MELYEREIPPNGRAIRVVQGMASAALEIHENFFTFYWRCRISPTQFVFSLMNRADGVSAMTLSSENGEVSEVPVESVVKNLSSLGSREFDETTTLVRFDDPIRSWVWQYAPDNDYRRLVKYSDSCERPGLVAYAGCASMVDHRRNFNAAIEFMFASGIESDLLSKHMSVFERNLYQWKRWQ